MNGMKRKLRRAELKILHSTGIFEVWRRRHRNDIAILMLHGTADPKRPSEWTPTRQQFAPDYIDWCLSVIKKYYNFITFEDAVAILAGEKSPVDYGFVITFDDGYRSNIVDALPVLKKHGAPMIVFIPVSNIEHRRPLWFDSLDYVLQVAAGDGHVFRVGKETHRFDLSGNEELKNSYAKFRQLIKSELKDENEFVSTVEETINHFERAAGKNLLDIFENDPWSALLRWDEIVAVQGKDVCFGSHTMNHYRIGHLKMDMLLYQFSESKKRIEARTGRECKFLAYPDDSFSISAANAAMECSYEAAVTTREGINSIGCDLMTLKRVCFPVTDDPVELLAYVSGFSKAISISPSTNK